MGLDETALEQLHSPLLADSPLQNIEASATYPYSGPWNAPSYGKDLPLDLINKLLLEKPDWDWEKTPPVAASPRNPAIPETPAFPPPVFDKAFHLESAKRQSDFAAHRIRISGGNAKDLRAVTNGKSCWEIEALHYTELLHEHLDRAPEAVAYWQQEAARKKESLGCWVSLINPASMTDPTTRGDL